MMDVYQTVLAKTSPNCNFDAKKSHVRVRNLHPGANLQPRIPICIPGVFWPCERCFKNVHPGAPGGKFAPTLEVVQIVHKNAKYLISIHYDRRF